MEYGNKVVYQIYPKSFLDSNGDGIGDIIGITSKIDYLASLGVDYLWLSPINCSPQYDNGYDISDYYGIDPMFGTLEDYRKLIEQCQQRKIKVMLDLVLNHTSSHHQWFQAALEGDSYYQDFYIWRDQPNQLQTYFSKSAWTYSPEVGKYYLHLFDSHQPDLNWENPHVRAEIYKMVNYWIDLGVAGFRLDVIDLIGKEPDKLITAKGPMFKSYLEELHTNTFKDKILTVGECWGASVEEANEMCTNGLTQVFHFEHLTTTNQGDKWEQKPVDFSEIVEVINKWQTQYPHSQNWVMNNHDMPRLGSLWYPDAPRYERSTLLFTLFGLLDGTTYLYQGEEFGMGNSNYDHINQINDVESINAYAKMLEAGLTENDAIAKINLISRDNPRVPVNWSNEEDRSFGSKNPWIAFSTDQYSYQQDISGDQSIFRYYQQIIALKKEMYTEYISQPLDSIKYENGIITIRRGKMITICNMTSEEKPKVYTANIILSNLEITTSLKAYECYVCLDK